jgi:hypothetical protein
LAESGECDQDQGQAGGHFHFDDLNRKYRPGQDRAQSLA